MTFLYTNVPCKDHLPEKQIYDNVQYRSNRFINGFNVRTNGKEELTTIIQVTEMETQYMGQNGRR